MNKDELQHVSDGILLRLIKNLFQSEFLKQKRFNLSVQSYQNSIAFQQQIRLQNLRQMTIYLF